MGHRVKQEDGRASNQPHAGKLNRMKYNRFEDLPVWKAAARLFVKIDALCESPEVSRQGDLGDQLHRATLSISNNIAEGFEQGTREQSLTFFYHAKGSAGEVRSMLTIMSGTPRFKNLKFEISNLKSESEEISKQLGAFVNALQNSEIKGHRYLNDTVRAQGERRARALAFDAKIKAMVAEAAAKRGQPVDA